MTIIPTIFTIPIFFLFITNAANLVNITVDDAGLDPLTHRSMSYYPVNGWIYGPSCSGCNARVDKTRAYESTWHDSTFDPGLPGTAVSSGAPGEVPYVEFNFTGVAVYVYCILSNSKQFPSGSSDMAFYIDGEQAGTFIRDADGSPELIYDFSVFANSSLPDGDHRLIIQNGHKNGKKVLTLLDRIVYTTSQKAEDNTTSTQEGNHDHDQQNQGGQGGAGTTKLGAILGGTLGGLGGLVLVGFGWLFWRRRNPNNQNALQQQLSGHSINPFPPIHPVPSVHPASPPAYADVEPSDEMYFLNGTDPPTTGASVPYRKERARYTVYQWSSSS